MRKFPGKIYMTKGKVHRLVMDDEQERWFRRWFPITANNRLAEAMGVSLYKVHDFARRMGLRKSEEGIKAIRIRQIKAMVRTNNRNGCYDRKRGRPVSDATIAGRARRWEEERSGLRENAVLRIKRESPDKYKALMEKRSESRKELIRKEKMRMLYGLERKTNVSVIRMVPYKRSQVAHRYNALKRGYVLSEDCSEGNPDRYIIYYDVNTIRNDKFERNCINDGFRIMEWIE